MLKHTFKQNSVVQFLDLGVNRKVSACSVLFNWKTSKLVPSIRFLIAQKFEKVLFYDLSQYSDPCNSVTSGLISYTKVSIESFGLVAEDSYDKSLIFFVASEFSLSKNSRRCSLLRFTPIFKLFFLLTTDLIPSLAVSIKSFKLVEE